MESGELLPNIEEKKREMKLFYDIENNSFLSFFD